MEFSAQQIAGILGGVVEGDENATVSQLAKIEEGSQGSLTFLANPKYTPFIYTTGATLAIVSKSFEPEEALPETLTLIRVEDPYMSFATLLEYYNNNRHLKVGISENSSISENAKVGNDVFIDDFTIVKSGAEIGEGCKIYGNVFIGEDVKIGNNSVI